MNTRRVTCGTSASAVVPAATLAALLWSPALPAKARVTDRQRCSDTDKAHGGICRRRFSIETTMTGTSMIKSSLGSLPYNTNDNYNIHEVLIDGTGEGFIVHQAGLYNDLCVRHARGTLYRFTGINAGQAFTIRALEGTAVERNRGVFQITYLVDTLGDLGPATTCASRRPQGS